MTKDGFIRELEECLQGEVSEGQLAETLDYYRSYYDDQVSGGNTEDEVSEQLGSPRLIARSVIDAYGTDDHIRVNDEYIQDEETGDYYQNDPHAFVRHRRYTGGSLVLGKFAVYAILIGVFLLSVLLIQALFPVILVGIVIWFFIRLFSR